MDRLTRPIASIARRLRRTRPGRWLAGRLPPRTRQAIRRLLGRPSSAECPLAAPVRATAPATAPTRAPVAAAPRLPFVPDGSGADPRANVIGHFRGEFGTAEAARSLVTAARAAGLRLALVNANPDDAAGGDLRYATAIGDETPHPINILCVNANDTVELANRLGPGVLSGRFTIGFWFWELSRFPAAWLGAVDRVDEIWVASEFVAQTMRAATSKPVRTVRLAVDATPSRPYARSEFGLPDDAYVFLFTFNFNSWATRKNPLGLIEAFRAAFPGDEPQVQLVLKSTLVDRDRERMRRFEEAIAADARIRVIDRFLSRDEVFGLESVVDSYVSLHRSEGFGLGLAESMFLGKPVIGTAYSGNLEFMDSSNSLLVDHRLTPVGPGEYPYPDGQEWADPDVTQAAALMRRLVDDPAFGRELGARARERMLRDFSPAAVGAGIAERIAAILDGTAG